MKINQEVEGKVNIRDSSRDQGVGFVLLDFCFCFCFWFWFFESIVYIFLSMWNFHLDLLDFGLFWEQRRLTHYFEIIFFIKLMLNQAQEFKWTQGRTHRMWKQFIPQELISFCERLGWKQDSALWSGMAMGIIKSLLNPDFKRELWPTANSKQLQGNSRRGKHLGGKFRT